MINYSVSPLRPPPLLSPGEVAAAPSLASVLASVGRSCMDAGALHSTCASRSIGARTIARAPASPCRRSTCHVHAEDVHGAVRRLPGRVALGGGVHRVRLAYDVGGRARVVVHLVHRNEA